MRPCETDARLLVESVFISTGPAGQRRARQAAVTLWEDLASVEGLAQSSDHLATADSLMGSGIVLGTLVTEVRATTSLSFFSHGSTA